MHCEHEECRRAILGILGEAAKDAESIADIEKNLAHLLTECAILDIARSDVSPEQAIYKVVYLAMDAKEVIMKFEYWKKVKGQQG